jgi:hypothetical protein
MLSLERSDSVGRLFHLCALALLLPVVCACSTKGESVAPPTRSTPGAELSTCPPVNPGGTVAPAIAICSVTYMVNGAEQVVRGGDALEASPGDTVQIGDIAICVGSFGGDGGQACVDFVPLDGEGGEITAGRRGTHHMKVTRGCQSIPGPEGAWTVGANWQSISAALNHWPPGRTEDLACADGLCERDDRLTANLG